MFLDKRIVTFKTNSRTRHINKLNMSESTREEIILQREITLITKTESSTREEITAVTKTCHQLQ
jgi:uncharacterized protein involved in tolerance to divalent cations